MEDNLEGNVMEMAEDFAALDPDVCERKIEYLIGNMEELRCFRCDGYGHKGAKCNDYASISENHTRVACNQ